MSKSEPNAELNVFPLKKKKKKNQPKGPSLTFFISNVESGGQEISLVGLSNVPFDFTNQRLDAEPLFLGLTHS